MSIEKSDILALIDRLMIKFNTALLMQAASLQVASSTIAASARSDIEKTIMQSVLDQRVDAELRRSGFTHDQLNEAASAIRLAGVAAHHLSLMNKPVTAMATLLADDTLKAVMYPCAEKTVVHIASFCPNHELMLLLSKLP